MEYREKALLNTIAESVAFLLAIEINKYVVNGVQHEVASDALERLTEIQDLLDEVPSV